MTIAPAGVFANVTTFEQHIVLWLSVLIPLGSLLWTMRRDTKQLKAQQKRTHNLLRSMANGHAPPEEE